MALDVSTLISSLSFWEDAGYVAIGIVALGCLGESACDFTDWFGEDVRKRVGRASALILIFGLAVEGVAQVNANGTTAQIVAVLNDEAAKATAAAKIAENNLAVLRERQTQRHLKPEEHQALVSALTLFAGQKATVSCPVSDEESCTYAEDFLSVLEDAHWDLGDKPGVNRGVFVGGDVGLAGIQVTLNQPDVQAGKVPAAVPVFVKKLVELNLIASKSAFINPGTPSGTIDVRVGARPPLSERQ